MKIKLPLTEKFLWDLYNFSNKAEDFLDSISSKRFYGLKTPQELLWPDIYTFKDAWEDKYRREREKRRFAQLVCRLRNSGYLKTLRIKGKSATILTPKGMEKLFKVKLKMINKKQRADKKWQMVLFDIPEEKRKHRDYFRKTLQYLGYKKLQKSIWVCPYDVLKETENLIKRYKLESYVELLLVKRVGLG